MRLNSHESAALSWASFPFVLFLSLTLGFSGGIIAQGCDDDIYLIDPATSDPYDLDSVQIQCEPDLPLLCDGTITANRGVVTCSSVFTSDGNDRNAVLATPAFAAADAVLGSAALKLFPQGGVIGDPGGRDFIPSGEGLFYYQSGNDFEVYGQVEDVNDASLVYDVSFKYTNGVGGDVWRSLGRGFKSEPACGITPDIEDGWLMYIMNTATVSYMSNANTNIVFEHSHKGPIS